MDAIFVFKVRTPREIKMDNKHRDLAINIHKGITQCFSLDELALLCFDLGISHDDIAGDTVNTKAREIIEYFSRQDRLDELVDYCNLKRPRYEWPQMGHVSDGEPTLEYASKGSIKGNLEYIKILFLAADPTDASRLRLGQEYREIQENLRLAKSRDKFHLAQRFSIRPADISQAILDEEPQFVHFSGHGTNTGELCFEDEVGQIKTITPDALAALFQLVSNQVECVILNACYSIAQANAIAAHIKYVVGMNSAISDNAAISFAVGFYQALGAGKSIDEAYKFGCVQIRLQGIPEHLIPIVMKKEH